jgi:hypothetical protein
LVRPCFYLVSGRRAPRDPKSTLRTAVNAFLKWRYGSRVDGALARTF